MNPQRFVPPAIEPLTVSEVKAHLRIDRSDEDSYLSSLITVARQAAETRMERTLIQSTWKLTLDRFPDAILLSMPPIVSVQSVSYTNSAGVSVVLSASDYVVDAISEPGWVVPAQGKSFPQALGINAVTVTYVAGYGSLASDVPAPIRHWLLLAIGEMYDGNRSVSAERPRVPQDFADGLLDPYRFFGV
jgi:uncharacterized phiE125 gp8 family phage protein